MVQEVRCEFKGKRVVISVYGEGDCELELWTADRKAKWFREVFGVEVQYHFKDISRASHQEAKLRRRA